MPYLGKPQKKVHPLVAGPLRGGKGRAFKEKITFLKLKQVELLGPVMWKFTDAKPDLLSE